MRYGFQANTGIKIKRTKITFPYRELFHLKIIMPNVVLWIHRYLQTEKLFRKTSQQAQFIPTTTKSHTHSTTENASTKLETRNSTKDCKK